MTQTTKITLSPADMRRLVRSERSRAEWLEKRREPDPAIRNLARHEAAHCRRIAKLIGQALRGPK